MKHDPREHAADEAMLNQKFLIFKRTALFCIFISLSFSLFIYSVIGRFSEDLVIDSLKTFAITSSASIPAGLIICSTFKKWHWALLPAAFIMQCLTSVGIIMIFIVQ